MYHLATKSMTKNELEKRHIKLLRHTYTCYVDWMTVVTTYLKHVAQ